LAKVAVQGKIERKESPEGLVVAQKLYDNGQVVEEKG